MDRLDGPVAYRQEESGGKTYQKKWRLTPDVWETLAKLCAVLKVSSIFDVAALHS